MTKERAVRDPIHGFVYLTSKEAEIVGSAIFQRLRGIRQLAFAHLVYPGAHHTRFEHSLGVCHIVDRLSARVRLDEEEKRLVRLAALLHDIGHGPFSHVSEDALEIYAKREKVGDGVQDDGASVHELLTQDFIRHDPELRGVLGERDCSQGRHITGARLRRTAVEIFGVRAVGRRQAGLSPARQPLLWGEIRCF